MENTETRFRLRTSTMKQQANSLASCLVYNMLQSLHVEGSRYKFSIQGTGRTRAQGWCLVQLVLRHMDGGLHLCWSLPIIVARPELLLKVARALPVTSTNIFAFLCLCYALLCTKPTRVNARMAYCSLSCLLDRIDLNYSFGYLTHGKHGWPEAIYRCLDE
ncbi:NS7c protein [Cynopterus bat coronavirus]|nr:NS7c protein [Cynopterus bat coronavirus]URD31275.1 NS7c protein [Cynopterus bat coronavirus]